MSQNGNNQPRGIDEENYTLGLRALELLGRVTRGKRVKFRKGTTIHIGKDPYESIPHHATGPIRINNHSYVWR